MFFELYAGAINHKKINDVKFLLKWLDIIEFDEEIAEMAGKIFIALKKQNNIIDYRDLFIGATSAFYNLEIATLNIDHFENFPNIKILNTSEV